MQPPRKRPRTWPENATPRRPERRRHRLRPGLRVSAPCEIARQISRCGLLFPAVLYPPAAWAWRENIHATLNSFRAIRTQAASCPAASTGKPHRSNHARRVSRSRFSEENQPWSMKGAATRELPLWAGAPRTATTCRAHPVPRRHRAAAPGSGRAERIERMATLCHQVLTRVAPAQNLSSPRAQALALTASGRRRIGGARRPDLRAIRRRRARRLPSRPAYRARMAACAAASRAMGTRKGEHDT
jgi:hypothetical protein